MRRTIEISIVLPCRNEVNYVAQCLDSLLHNTYPKNSLEILVVDGMSTDGTRRVLERYQRTHPFIRVIENPKKIIPSGMNLGITQAEGRIIMKADVHTIYHKDYIEKCVRALEEHDVENVGGVLQTQPGADTIIAKAIAWSLTHPFGVGSSPFRGAAPQSQRLVDTVAFGCYKKDIFKEIGLYNEDLVRSSDMDLNVRLRKKGGKILLIPDIVAYYYADATLWAFLRHNLKDGMWTTYPLKFTKTLFRPRHFVPFICLVAAFLLLLTSLISKISLFVLLALMFVYVAGSVAASAHIALREKSIWFLFLMPVVFAVRHGAYGLGSVWGAIKILVP